MRFILSLGFARCGTTATDDFMRRVPGLACPVERKEIKYFMRPDASYSGYLEQFEPGQTTFFEASPPYAGRGMARFEAVLQAIARELTPHGEVHVLFCLRGLLQRAFSHYRHTIGTRYSMFGAAKGVTAFGDPRRYSKLYSKSFAEELADPMIPEQILPDAASMITRTAEIFGSDRVRIAYTKRLDGCLADYLSQMGLTPDIPLQSERIPGAEASWFIAAGHKGLETTVRLRSGDEANVRLPPDSCLLLNRRHIELLTADKAPVKELVASSEHWTRDFDVSTLDSSVRAYLDRQAEVLGSLPASCFLAGTRDECLADIAAPPDRLSIKPTAPRAGLLRQALVGAA